MVSVELVLVAVDPVHVDVVLARPRLGPSEPSTGVPEHSRTFEAVSHINTPLDGSTYPG